MIAGNRRCVGFPVGSCSIRDNGRLDNASKKELATYEIGFIGDICFSCKWKREISKRKKKTIKLLHRQDEHELNVLKILMSELTVKEDKTVRYSKTDRKGRVIQGSLEEHIQAQDKLFLDNLFKIIQNKTKLEDLPEVKDETSSLFRNVDLDEVSGKVWWTQTHIGDKWEDGWKEGNKTVVNPKTNPSQIKKFLARLEGVRCEECKRNTYNLSENICKNTKCPGRMIDEYGDSVPSTNIKNQSVNVIRKWAKLDTNSRKIERIMEGHPNAEDPIQIRNSFIDERGKKINDTQNIVWRVTREGVNRVALYECFANIKMD